MVFILGVNLPDKKLARIALTSFYGVGMKTAHRICARMQIHDEQRVGSLTPQQITSLASFLASPSTSAPLPRLPLAPPSKQAVSVLKPDKEGKVILNTQDPLLKIKVETELRREVRENIAHQRMIGSYVGRRHAMGLPVRGQRTQTNAKTAKKLNRVERFG